MKVLDQRAKLTRDGCLKIWDKVDATDNYFKTVWDHEPLSVFIQEIKFVGKNLKSRFKQWVYDRFSPNFPFKVELSSDGENAEVHAYCGETQGTDGYDKTYLEKIGTLLEQEGFNVTVRLVNGNDC
jgi:hypothetical protein